jgi:hypothetical protein
MKCKQLGGDPVECKHASDSDLQCNNCSTYNNARLRSKSVSGEPQICQHDSGIRCIHIDWGCCTGCDIFEV